MRVPAARPNGAPCDLALDLAPGTADVPLELRRPQREQMHHFVEGVIRAHPGQFCNGVWQRGGAGGATVWNPSWNVGDVITRLQALLSMELGLDNIVYLPVSRLSTSDAFLDFLAFVLGDPIRFANCYNQAVAEQMHGRRRGSNAVRALSIEYQEKRTELPFWFVRPDGRRTDLQVNTKPEASVELVADDSELGRLPTGAPQETAQRLAQLQERTGWTIRPKAVCLTLFIRLYLADWFIHGVGGQDMKESRTI
jgi:hypothetical protein